MPDITIRVRGENEAGPGFDDVQGDISRMREHFVDANEKMRKESETTGSRIKAALQKGIGSAGKGGGALGIFIGLVTAANVAGQAVVFALRKSFALAGTVIQGLVSVARSVFDTVVSVAKAAFSAVVSAAKGAASLIGSAFGLVGDVFGKVFSQTTALLGLFGGAGITAAAIKLGGLSASIQDLRRTFRNLSSSAGQDFNAIFDAIQRGTRGAASEMQTLQFANNALLLNVAKTPEQFEQISNAALVLSQSMGISLARGLDSIALGIGRQSRLLLDNLGIIAKVDDATRKFASKKTNLELSDRERTIALLAAAEKKLAEEQTFLLAENRRFADDIADVNQGLLDAAVRSGNFSRILNKQEQAAALAAASTEKLEDAISGLSEEERRQAFLEATLEAAAQKSKEAGGAVETLSLRFARLRNSMTDVVTQIADTVSPALGFVADLITPIASNFRKVIAASEELNAARIEHAFQVAAEVIGGLVSRLPVLRDLLLEVAGDVRENLATAFSFLADVGLQAVTGLLVGFRLAQREFGVFRDAIAGLFNGEGFDASGSVIIAGLELIRARVEEKSLAAANAILGAIGPVSVQILDSLENALLAPIDRFLEKASEALILVGTIARQNVAGEKLFGPGEKLVDAGVDLLALSTSRQRSRERRQETPAEERFTATRSFLRGRELEADTRGDVAESELRRALDQVRPAADQDLDDLKSFATEAAELFSVFKANLDEFQKSIREDGRKQLEALKAQNEAANRTIEGLDEQARLNAEMVEVQSAVVDQQVKTRREIESNRRRLTEIAQRLASQAYTQRGELGLGTN